MLICRLGGIHLTDSSTAIVTDKQSPVAGEHPLQHETSVESNLSIRENILQTEVDGRYIKSERLLYSQTNKEDIPYLICNQAR
jgi:hypothetical protein